MRGPTIQDYLDELNQRVFFWPGTLKGPVPSGRRHFGRYSKEDDAFVIRAPLDPVLDANTDRVLFVAKCNSGAARHHGSQPARRGPKTFVTLDEALFPPSLVVELSFLDRVELPRESQFSNSLQGPWQPL